MKKLGVKKMIFIDIGFGWFLLCIVFVMFIGFSMMLEYDYDKLISKLKIFIISIVFFIVSVILMILSLSTV